MKRLHRRRLAGSFTLLIYLLIGGVATHADVPPRSPGALTLEAPEADLDRGQIYYVTPGQDAQLTLTSEAELQVLRLVQSRVVGYLVAPFDFEDDSSPLLGGALRIPTATFTSGSSETDRWLLGSDLFDAAAHPELTFEILGARNFEALESDDEESFVFRLTVQGKLGIGDSVHEIDIPAELEFLLSSRRTMSRWVGDMAILRARFPLRPAELGFKPPPELSARLAETFTLELFLLANTVSPDKSLDPSLPPAKFGPENRFLVLLRDLADPDAAYAHARAYMERAKYDHGALRRLTRVVLDEPGLARRDLAFALAAARRAAELEPRDPGTLAEVARVFDARGQVEEAITWQKRAAANLEGAPEAIATQIRTDLARYKKGP